ncbi:MAG: citrate synthase [Euryarchaeota archaeon]|nr:citrate synthase [Euryarchaeota archaeon]
MVSTLPTEKGGLEGIVVGKTSLSSIDGVRGILTYRGYDIGELATNATFEEVAYLLWYGLLPKASHLVDLEKRLVAERELRPEILDTLKLMAHRTAPMEVLRTGVSLLGAFDPDVGSNAPEANIRKAIRLTAKLPTMVAAYSRLRAGKEPVAPNPVLSHAANFIYMLQGTDPDAEIKRDFDVCLTLHADHGFNASTFAARVTASTLADMHSAVTSAVGTLKGPLHGGANTEVMHLLEEIGDVSRVHEVVNGKLQRKEKVPGFGHRIYKTLDPRAVHLKDISERLGKRSGNLKWYEMSTKIQAIMKQQKSLDANVDFYSASAYHYMGIEADLFTPIFALARIVGWTAHVMEQHKDNRLIRPESEYTGPKEQKWVPMEMR